MNLIRNGFNIFIIIFIANILYSNEILQFKYPTSTLLRNKNILVIEENGIFICDNSLSKINNTIISFTEDDKITLEKLSTVILINKEDYIISLIDNQIYFFDPEGNLIYNSQKLIYSYSPTYISLTPIVYENNCIDYVVSYFDSDIHLRLLYYQFEVKTKNNTFISETIEKKFKDIVSGKYSYSSYNFKHQGLSCVYIEDYYEKYYYKDYFYLVCFFVIEGTYSYYLEQSVYKINNGKIENSYNYYYDYIKINYNTINQIKADINKYLDAALVCIVYSDNNTECYKFDLYSYKTRFYSSITFNYKCSSELYGIKVSYLRETQETFFSCILSTETGGIQTIFFGKNLETPNYLYKQFLSCSNIYGYSIIYTNNDYYIILDITCNSYNNKYFAKLINNDEDNDIDINELEDTVNYNTEKTEQKNFPTPILIPTTIPQNSKITTNQIEISNDIIPKNICPEKCKECTEYESEIICTVCNIEKEYFPISFSDSLPLKLEDCINKSIKQEKYSDYYYDIETGFFLPCDEKCKICSEKGNEQSSNCITCAIGYILQPDKEYTKNCVPNYKYLYYYNEYNIYSTTDTINCPENFPIKIPEKNKCIDKCSKDPTFNYTYNNICFKQCPEKSLDTDGDLICEDDPTKCVLTNNEFYISNNTNISLELQLLIEKYAKEYNYTENHVSLIQLGNYNLTLYKNKSCISELSVSSKQLDLSSATSKVKNHYNMSDNKELIVGIIKNNKGSESFEVYDPSNGKPLNIFEICKDDTYSLQKNLTEQLSSNSKINFNDLQDMANQDINVIDLSDPFYNDICFHYESKFNKDVPLRDRVSIYYPNISLCDAECELEAVYIKNWTAKCNCFFNEKKGGIKDNALYQSQFGEVEELISLANIHVMKCYKDIFKFKFFKKSYGNFIILSIIIINIICSILYFVKGAFQIKKFIFILTSKFLKHLKKQNSDFYISFNNNINNMSNNIKKLIVKNEEIKYNAPPLKNIGNNISNINNNSNNEDNNNENTNKKNNCININVNNDLNTNNNIKENNENNNNQIKGKSIKKIKKKRGMSTKTAHIFKIKNNKLDNISSITNNIKKEEIGSNYSNFNNSDEFRMKNKSKTNIMSKKNVFLNERRLSNDLLNSNNEKNNQNILNIQNNLEIIMKDDIDINIEEFLKTDPDDMDYDEALRGDERKFYQYYWDKIQSNQILINTFYYKEHLKTFPIKLMLLALRIDLYFFINGLFYNEEYVKKIFDLEKDTLDKAFTRFIDNLFYAFLAGIIINYIIDFFFIEEKKIRMTLKREKENLLILKYEMTQIIKDINKRYISFIIICFIISIFTWYHIYCFNNIYPHMQKEWLIFSVLILVFVQILSLLASLAETIFRFLSFKFKSEKMFKLSQLLA